MADITEPHHRLFVLQWGELFGEESLDTWQVRTSNVLSILEEVEEVTRVARTEHAPVQAALEPLLAEALGVLQRDLVVAQCFPFCNAELTELRSEVVHDGALSAPKLEDIARRARVLREQLSRSYRQEAIRLLRALLASDGTKKEDQLYLTMTVATELAREGFTLQHLRAVGDGLVRAGRPFLERVDELFSLCADEEQQFDVLFVVREWDRGIEPPREARRISSRDDARSRVARTPRADDFFAKTIPSDRIVSVSVKARDPFGARGRAESLLMTDFASVAFSTRQEPSLASNGDALVLAPGEVAMLTPADGTRRAAMVRPRDWRDRATNLLALERLLRTEDLHQISATLQYFRLAVGHQSDEVRLVNLWVSAETLVRGAAHGSTLQRVGAMVPVLAVRNIRRVLKGFARRLTGSLKFKQLRATGLLHGHDEKVIPPARLLATLKDETKARAVLALLDHDPLLRYRLHRFADKALKSGATAAEYMEANARNIEWQLGRIYRARNALVHRGEPPQALRQLLQHLETYVWTVIRQVTEQLTRANGRWSVGDCLEHWRSVHAHALRVLRSSPSLPIEALVEPSEFLKLVVQSPPPPAKGAQKAQPGHV